MLYAIRGKFADGHTFSAQVDADSPAQAMTNFSGFEQVTGRGSPVVQISAQRKDGKTLVRISKEPAKPRAKGAGRKPATANAAAPSVGAVTSTGNKKR